MRESVSLSQGVLRIFLQISEDDAVQFLEVHCFRCQLSEFLLRLFRAGGYYFGFEVHLELLESRQRGEAVEDCFETVDGIVREVEVDQILEEGERRGQAPELVAGQVELVSSSVLG